MCKQEEKYCSRCGGSFECKIDDIERCLCYGIKLTDRESDFITHKFSDCLCAGGMTAMKSEYSIL